MNAIGKMQAIRQMQAIVQTKYGSADVLQLQEVEKPSPKENEVLIKIIATPATTADNAMLSGPYLGRLFGMGLTKPKNPTNIEKTIVYVMRRNFENPAALHT